MLTLTQPTGKPINQRIGPSPTTTNRVSCIHRVIVQRRIHPPSLQPINTASFLVQSKLLRARCPGIEDWKCLLDCPIARTRRRAKSSNIIHIA